VTDDDRLDWILSVVERSLDEPDIDGLDLASRAYLSRSHFARLVASALGEPPGALRRRVLLERAAHRLVTTSHRVIDIALTSGYATPEGFARAFSRAYGVAPSEYRRRGPRRHELSAASGVHFHPPGGLRLPPTTRSNNMDVLHKMLEHHLWLVGEIVDRSARVAPDELDHPIELSVEGIDEGPTLRSLCDRLVGQLEMWNAAIDGETAMPPAGDTTAAGLRERLATASRHFRTSVMAPVAEGRADETFVDAVCEPPETFTYGGVLAHVLTFAAVRRTMAIGALERAGVSDLGSGDPMHFVAGTGSDASGITRRRAE
jgi:AraC family transcriptional regulator